MEKLSLTTLRNRLFEVADRVLDTGVPVAIERRGKTLLLTPQDTRPKLARLKRRKLVKGPPESLTKVKAGTWRELQNLK
jgi:prevent-host-death family protein